MGKVFTITEGLENLGAMKTGGQGSVYKGRRIGEIITAIKLLPTPIHSESPEDKSFMDFQNEVQKLKKVNESPNPNVVKILSSGVSDTGNFPFIEMEYIEGPDLEELLKPPHPPVFTIKETLKVAEQLSNALAHCHRVEVRHGDIKSNNVKFDIHTGNYVLLDFGLAVMSDEERRTSLRHAGAIEFMAPEQNEGQMLYQTDVYSFGVILFELLTGEVPFPLSDKGETARNTVRLSHMETPPPDLLEKRRQALPDGWTKDKIQHEMHVPEWLLSMIYKCLAKKADQRFSNGIELHDYIVLNSTLAAKRDEDRAEEAALLREENRKLMKMKDQLQQNLLRYQQEAAAREKELQQLRAAVSGSTVVSQPTYTERLGEVADTSQQKGVSRTAFLALLLLTIGLAAFATYSYFSNQGTTSDQVSIAGTDTTSAVDSSNLTRTDREGKINVPVAANTQTPAEVVTNQPAVNNSSPKKSDTLSQPQEQENTEEKVNNDENKNDEKDEDEDKQEKTGGRYKVRNVAYFHNQPDETTRRNAFINHWNNAILNPLEEQSGFIYIVFTNDEGQVSKGWLRKKDLIRLKD